MTLIDKPLEIFMNFDSYSVEEKKTIATEISDFTVITLTPNPEIATLHF